MFDMYTVLSLIFDSLAFSLTPALYQLIAAAGLGTFSTYSQYTTVPLVFCSILDN